MSTSTDYSKKEPLPLRVCAISGKTMTAQEEFPCSALRPALLRFIQKQHPVLSESDWIDRSLLPALKALFVEDSLGEEIGEITSLERAVIESMKEQEILAAHPDDDDALAQRTFGEKLADLIASFGGSWRFIICFGIFILLWVLANTLVWLNHPPDPFPYILLNLVLSCLASLQAPLIMMSQNRVEARDRRRAELDYQINLKAELEIRHLHEKLDHLLHHHSERLLEIQNIQTELLRQLLERR